MLQHGFSKHLRMHLRDLASFATCVAIFAHIFVIRVVNAWRELSMELSERTSIYEMLVGSRLGPTQTTQGVDTLRQSVTPDIGRNAGLVRWCWAPRSDSDTIFR